MRKTLYYFNAFIEYNNEVTNIHLSDLFDEIRIQHVRRRVKHLKQGNICLMNMMLPTENRFNNYDDRKVVIGKFRDDKPYLSNLGTDRIDEINDDVIELTSVLYQRSNRLLIVEYNHYGLRPNGLQYYLNSFMPVTENDRWSVVLEPIEPSLGFTDVSQSDDIKNIEFKVDLTARNRRIYQEQNSEDENTSVLGNILSQSIETHEEFGANFATIGFSNGRKWRKNVIDAEDLVETLRALDLDSDIFESIKVTYISPTTGKKENLDLKNQGILKEILEVEENGWQYICDSIENHFYNAGKVGEGNHRNYRIETSCDLPELLYTDFESE